jgi:hypothetical protein
MDLIIIIILLCCCSCIILSGGGYFYITNSSNKITSEQLSTTKQSPNTSEQSPNTSEQLSSTTTPIPVIKWVICGNDIKGLPSIAYSYDGKLWEQVKTIILENGKIWNLVTGMFNSVAYNGTMWVAVGQVNLFFIIATSINGINWKLNDVSNQYNGSGKSICWTGSMWVAVGSTNIGTTCCEASVITSTDGLNWIRTYNSTIVNTYFNSVAYNPSIKTLVASGGNSTAYSKDGINWTSISCVTSSVIRDLGITKITIINSQFVAAVGAGTNLINSTDGITWNRYNNTIPSDIMSNPDKISLFNNTMIAGGFGVFQLVYSSDQGKTWIGSLTALNSLNRIFDIATNNSDIVLAVGYDRNRAEAKMVGQVLTSTDGIKWSLPNFITFMSQINGIASNIPL